MGPLGLFERAIRLVECKLIWFRDYGRLSRKLIQALPRRCTSSTIGNLSWGSVDEEHLQHFYPGRI